MIDSLPKGITIGTMQAPVSWIFTHTSRFVGIVRITIQEGRGVILIEKGKPRAFYFQHGQRILRGNAAKDYFSAQPVVDFSLDKLTEEEFSRALAITGSDQHDPPRTEVREVPLTKGREIPEQKGRLLQVRDSLQQPESGTRSPDKKCAPITGQAQDNSVTAPDHSVQPAKYPLTDIPLRSSPENEAEPARPEETAIPAEQDDPFDIYETLPKQDKKKTDAQPSGNNIGLSRVTEFREFYPDDGIPEADLKMISQILLGRIKAIPGVIAVLVFNKDMNLLSIGDVNLDSLVSSAEDMLMTVNQIDSVMEWGSFVQMTIQVPTGHVIIAPFFDEYLCILTSPEINLGRIRRILREIKTQQNR